MNQTEFRAELPLFIVLELSHEPNRFYFKIRKPNRKLLKKKMVRFSLKYNPCLQMQPLW